jgi:ketosteroid isomerase-like protein
MYAGFGDLARGANIANYVAAHYVPACEYLPVEERAAIVGRDAMVAWNERWFEAWDELSVDATYIQEERDTVVSEVRVRARGAASGMEIDQTFFHVIDLENGKIRRMREFTNREEALRGASDGGP